MSKTVLSVRKYKITSYFPNISNLYGKSFPTTSGTINNGGRLTVPSLTVPPQALQLYSFEESWVRIPSCKVSLRF